MKQTENSAKNASSFYSNSACEYFPCHAVTEREQFNCLFCYCPLYPMGKDCGGAYVYLENGIKDCSNCTFPHDPENYDAIMQRLTQYYCEDAQLHGKEGKK